MPKFYGSPFRNDLPGKIGKSTALERINQLLYRVSTQDLMGNHEELMFSAMRDAKAGIETNYFTGPEQVSWYMWAIDPKTPQTVANLALEAADAIELLSQATSDSPRLKQMEAHGRDQGQALSIFIGCMLYLRYTMQVNWALIIQGPSRIGESTRELAARAVQLHTLQVRIIDGRVSFETSDTNIGFPVRCFKYCVRVWEGDGPYRESTFNRLLYGKKAVTPNSIHTLMRLRTPEIVEKLKRKSPLAKPVKPKEQQDAEIAGDELIRLVERLGWKPDLSKYPIQVIVKTDDGFFTAPILHQRELLQKLPIDIVLKNDWLETEYKRIIFA